QNGKIARIYKPDHHIDPKDTGKTEVIENHFRRLVFPGFIQCHIHFCQTLHRNLAEEMPLMEWLKKEIWPYEGAHTAKTMGKSVMMSLKEVLSCGTTAVLDMGTVHHQDVIFDIMAKTGFRYTGGKAMMDQCEGAPDGLAETTDDSISQSMELVDTFHGKKDGLLHYAFAPRFVLSCSTALLKEVRRISDENGVI
ncbi:MAG: amidohydrolase family protein, partial [bacterium]|nr:amidohydrolase family protein [bacterium]